MLTLLNLSTCALIIFVALIQILSESQASPTYNRYTLIGIDQKYISRSKRANDVSDVGKPQRAVNQDMTEDEKKTTVKTTNESNEKPATVEINCSLPENHNSSQCRPINSVAGEETKSLLDQMKDTDMLLRTLYVTLGVTGIVIVYFIVRAVRLRRRRTKSRKYGIITQQGDRGDLEMEPLGDGNEDEEDYTVFEVNGRKK